MPQYLSEKLQSDVELTWLIELFLREGVSRYLEIGSRFGGSFYRIGSALRQGATLVSVDLPVDFAGRDSLLKAAQALRAQGKSVTVVWADSRSDEARAGARVNGVQNGSGWLYDAVFIDADHKLESVVLDWINYGALARIVAFHDVGFVLKPSRSELRQKRIDVPDLWNVLKWRYPEKCSQCVEVPGEWGIGALVR